LSKVEVKLRMEVNAMNTLRSMRQEKGWSQSELARRSRLNSVTVSAIESGRLVPYPSQLRKLAKALALSALEVGRLCGGMGTGTPSGTAALPEESAAAGTERE
jgi:transcriptional regulator with XRE-family HTH domain